MAPAALGPRVPAGAKSALSTLKKRKEKKERKKKRKRRKEEERKKERRKKRRGQTQGRRDEIRATGAKSSEGHFIKIHLHQWEGN